jgi:hypothetical protein
MWLLNIRGNDVKYTPMALSYMLVSDSFIRLYIDKEKASDAYSYLEENGVTVCDYLSVYSDLSALDEGSYLAVDFDNANYNLIKSIKCAHKDIKDFSQLLQFIEYSSKHDKRVYIPRAITGKLAEEFFEKDFECNTDLPRGVLKDCRDNGCGYDYEIISADNQVSYVEVKGIAEDCGGVLFTNKEWDTAQNEGDRYYLCVVRNINEGEPTIQYIKNPAQVLSPSKHIQTIIQVSYSVTNKELVKLI